LGNEVGLRVALLAGDQVDVRGVSTLLAGFPVLDAFRQAVLFGDGRPDRMFCKQCHTNENRLAAPGHPATRAE